MVFMISVVPAYMLEARMSLDHRHMGYSFHVAITPVKLDTVIGHAICHFRNPPFGHGDLPGDILSRHVVGNKIIDKGPTQFHFGGHLHDLKGAMLNRPIGFPKASRSWQYLMVRSNMVSAAT